MTRREQQDRYLRQRLRIWGHLPDNEQMATFRRFLTEMEDWPDTKLDYAIAHVTDDWPERDTGNAQESARVYGALLSYEANRRGTPAAKLNDRLALLDGTTRERALGEMA